MFVIRVGTLVTRARHCVRILEELTSSFRFYFRDQSYGGGRSRSNDVVRSNSNTKRPEKENRDTMTRELSYGGGRPRSNDCCTVISDNTEGDVPNKEQDKGGKKNFIFSICYN